jgi:thermitase
MRPTEKIRSIWVAAVIVTMTVVMISTPTSRQGAGDPISGLSGVTFIAGADEGEDYVQGEVVVELKARRNAQEIAARHTMTVLDDLEDDVYLFGILDGRTVQQAIDELNADRRDVKSAEPNYKLQPPEVDQRSVAFVDQRSVAFVDGVSPADYFAQTALLLIQAGAAQATGARGGGVTVAVIDTGVDVGHPTFNGNTVQGYDYVDNDTNAAEEGSGPAYGHGTMVAGIIALVAPESTVLPVRAFDADGVSKASKVSQAIRYAARRGVEIINMSFGAGKKATPIEKAITFASRQGITLVASAGNDDTSFPEQYPASDQAVLGIAATDNNDVRAAWSNYGSHIAVCAPGVSIYSAYPGGRFAWGDGTSYAAAFVSGEAALLYSTGSANVEQTIKSTAVNIDSLNPGFRNLLGSGRIDALAAVQQ